MFEKGGGSSSAVSRVSDRLLSARSGNLCDSEQ